MAETHDEGQALNAAALQAQYGAADYWDKRYTREPTAFDWYQDYNALAPIFDEYLPRTRDILQVGVGTSRLQEEMVKNGYISITNIDYSKVVISHMSEMHKHLTRLKYMVLDARDMKVFRNGTFGGVIDKGTLDAILCGDQSTTNATSMLREISRVLAPEGVFALVTYGDPNSRLPYLISTEYRWGVELFVMAKESSDDDHSLSSEAAPLVIRGPFSSKNLDLMRALCTLQQVHYVYICTKQREQEEQVELDGASS